MAKCYSSLGRKTDATRTYSKVLELDPSNAAALRETAELRQVENFKKQAQLAAEGGHFNSAVSLLVCARTRSGRQPRAHLRSCLVASTQQ